MCYPSFFPVTPPQYISLYLILLELIMEVLDDPILQIQSLFLHTRTHTHTRLWTKFLNDKSQSLGRNSWFAVSCPVGGESCNAALASLWMTVCQMEAVKSYCCRSLLSALSLWACRVRITVTAIWPSYIHTLISDHHKGFPALREQIIYCCGTEWGWNCSFTFPLCPCPRM